MVTLKMPNNHKIKQICTAAALVGIIFYYVLEGYIFERKSIDGQAMRRVHRMTELTPNKEGTSRQPASKQPETARSSELATLNDRGNHNVPIRLKNPYHEQIDKLYNKSVPVPKVDTQWFYSPWERARQRKYRYNCAAVKRGDLSEISRISYRLGNQYTPAESEDVYEWVKNCSAYRPYVEFKNKYTTQEEREFPIAFGLRMHQGVEQAEQLLRHIYAPQNIYCIYIDKKSPPEIHKTMRQIAECFDNIFVATKLENFYYGWSSHVQADKQCMADALNKSKDWKYFINLVGEVFPLKTNLEIVRNLKALAGHNGMHTLQASEPVLHERMHRVWELRGGRVVPTQRIRPTYNGTALFYKASVYGQFSRNFVKWNLEANFPRNFEKYLAQGTMNSDEIYWGTVARQPDTPGSYHRDTFLSSVAVLWWGEMPGPCYGRWERWVCILTVKSLKWLSQQPEPFANKFKMDVDLVAVDCLAEWMTLKRVKGIVEYGHPIIE